MSLEVFPFTAFDFPDHEPVAEARLVNETILVMDGVAKTVTHVDLHDRNDSTGYFGNLLDGTGGDVRRASRILMDSMINHR